MFITNLQVRFHRPISQIGKLRVRELERTLTYCFNYPLLHNESLLNFVVSNNYFMLRPPELN